MENGTGFKDNWFNLIAPVKLSDLLSFIAFRIQNIISEFVDFPCLFYWVYQKNAFRFVSQSPVALAENTTHQMYLNSNGLNAFVYERR